MNWVAWKMLTGDRAKYFGTVFGVAFGVLLISQQTSIFVGIISRTASQVIDVRELDFWVMDPYTQNADDIKPLSESDVYRVRGVEGVDWVVPLYKGQTRRERRRDTSGSRFSLAWMTSRWWGPVKDAQGEPRQSAGRTG